MPHFPHFPPKVPLLRYFGHFFWYLQAWRCQKVAIIGDLFFSAAFCLGLVCNFFDDHCQGKPQFFKVPDRFNTTCPEFFPLPFIHRVQTSSSTGVGGISPRKNFGGQILSLGIPTKCFWAVFKKNFRHEICPLRNLFATNPPIPPGIGLSSSSVSNCLATKWV